MIRFLDIIISFFVLLFLSPIFIIITIVIVLESRGGGVFKQERVGLNRKLFTMYKFRTMFKDSERKSLLTVGFKDSRITKSGYFLRKFKLDEFPQFLNVLNGKMSIVGPRPEVIKYVDLYKQDQLRILSVRPGITDFASLKFFNENELLAQSPNPEEFYINEIMPKKIEINLFYVDNYTIKNYFKVILLTIKRIIFR